MLNHDTPDGTRDDYNTTGDVLRFMEGTQYRRYFSRPGEPFIVALCFKSAPALCGSSTESQHWRALVDELFEAAQQTLARATLNVQFVLDGDAIGGAICDCLKDRWRPWVATYTVPTPFVGQQPGSCLQDAFTCDDPTRGLDRFAVLNEPSDFFHEGAFKNAAEQHYGKFVNSSYNWQIYEPRDEAEIDARLREYAEAGIAHAAGLRFAINVDSSMLQVWVAGANLTGRRGWSDPIVPEGRAPTVIILPTPTTRGRRLLVLAYALPGAMEASWPWRAAAPESRFALRSFAGAAGVPLSVEDDGLLPRSNHDAKQSTLAYVLSSARWPGAAHGVLATDSAGHVSAMHVAEDGTSVMADGRIQALDLTLSLTGDVSGTIATAASACPKASGIEAAIVCSVQLVLDANATLQLRLWALTPASARILASVAVPTPDSVSASAHLTAAVCSLGIAADGTLSAALAWSSQGRVAVALAAWAPRLGTLALVAGPKDVGVGSQPHLSFAEVTAGTCAKSRGVLMLAVEDGFCQDNERINKATHPGACDQVPHPTPTVLTASYGRVEEWEAKLQSAAAAMSGCDTHVMHGAYSRGTKPSAAVFAVPSTTQLPAGFSLASVHEGTRWGTPDYGECGLARAHGDALVLSGWVPADLCDAL